MRGRQESGERDDAGAGSDGDRGNSRIAGEIVAIGEPRLWESGTIGEPRRRESGTIGEPGHRERGTIAHPWAQAVPSVNQNGGAMGQYGISSDDKVGQTAVP